MKNFGKKTRATIAAIGLILGGVVGLGAVESEFIATSVAVIVCKIPGVQCYGE